MIVRDFLQWMRNASALERADGTTALARAYLYSPLSEDDRAATEGAMLTLLDDPSPMVRLALANTLASSQKAPPAVIHALAADQSEIAEPVLQSTPLLVDTDLVDIVANGNTRAQCAVARRAMMQRSVAAALAEVGCAEACLILVENDTADIAIFSANRIVARHGHLAAIREALLARDDLAPSTRQLIVAKLSQTLADFVSSRAWLASDRAIRITKEACEKATVMLASESGSEEVRPLIRHLRETGQLNAGLMLRALLCGNVAMFEEALADLADMPLDRVIGLVHGRSSAGFRAVYDKAGLPASTFPAFREAVATMQDDDFTADGRGHARLKRRMIERVLTRCESIANEDIEPLMTLLRRFATEAARDEARTFCDEMVFDHDDYVEVVAGQRLIAA